MKRYLISKDGLSIAYRHLPGKHPTVIFMPGFFSHMKGTKALWLERRCRERGQSYIRFDYRGHGESDGKFEDGTVSDWLNDALLVLDNVAESPVLAVGSSMGGWIAVLTALARPGMIRGLIGVASSPDFTRSIWEERLTENQREEMDRKGYILSPSEYREDPVKITRKLITDGEKHLLLYKKKLSLNIPVCLIHGKKDEDVSWKKSQQLHDLIGEEFSELIFVPDGKHRLSRPQDLELIDRAVQKISVELSGNQ
jgi:pimeloyl-ACP methyl ester carboxylesterase